MRRIRYVFTVVMPLVELPDNPLAQNLWIKECVEKIKNELGASQVGVTAVVEDGDGAQIPSG